MTKTHATTGRSVTPTETMCSEGEPTSRAATHRPSPLPRTIHPRAESISGSRRTSRLALDRHADLLEELGEDGLGGARGHGGVCGDDDAVREDWDRQRLHVVGDHVVASLRGGEGS